VLRSLAGQEYRVRFPSAPHNPDESRLQREKAFRLLSEAADEIQKALKPPDKLQPRDREISADMYLTLIICLDLLGDYKSVRAYLQTWQQEHPDDVRVAYQRDFIEKKRGVTIEELAALRPQVQTTSRARPF
jgi:hypothetical protein